SVNLVDLAKDANGWQMLAQIISRANPTCRKVLAEAVVALDKPTFLELAQNVNGCKFLESLTHSLSNIDSIKLAEALFSEVATLGRNEHGVVALIAMLEKIGLHPYATD